MRRAGAHACSPPSGIAVGVATIVALLSFTQGLQQTAAGSCTWAARISASSRRTCPNRPPRCCPNRSSAASPRRPDVARATPLMLIVEGDQAGALGGRVRRRAGGFFTQQPGARRAAGGRPSDAGNPGRRPPRRTAAPRRRGPADASRARRYRVAGVYHSGVLFEDSGAVLDLGARPSSCLRPAEETDVVVQLASGAQRRTRGRARSNTNSPARR